MPRAIAPRGDAVQQVDDAAEIRVAQVLHQCAGKAAEYADDARDQGLCAVENGLEHLQEFAVLQGRNP